MGGILSGNSNESSPSPSPSPSESREMAMAKAKELVSTNPVMIFSKSYCQFSGQVKRLLSQLNASYKVMELDQESDGYEVQSALVEWTGQRTVPNVFIGGKHIGGCDSVITKHRQGKLVALLTEAGALAT